MTTQIRIPISQPSLDGNEEAYLLEALRSTRISSSGAFLDRFEKEFAEACGTKHALAVSNGTTALHLALLALDVRPGDEVLVPSLTYIATANAVRYVGAEPVFVDADPETWCMDPKSIEQSITPRTKGIIPVHLYGCPANMSVVNMFAQSYGLWVVEDAAEAHYATFQGQRVGGLGTIGTFSFYGNKIFTCGEGGAVTFNRDDLLPRLKSFRGQGVDPNRRYFHPVTGYNFRLTNLQASLLCAQLERADTLLAKRNYVCRWYKERLNNHVKFQYVWPCDKASPWMMCVLIDGHLMRDVVANTLKHNGIETRPMFVPLHQLPPFREASNLRGECLSVSNNLSKRGLCLPTYPDLTEHEVDEICSIIVRSL